MKQFHIKNITKSQSQDTGMAVVLLLLIFSFVFKQHQALLVKIALAAQVLNMIHPPLYRPVAVVWLGLSHVIGTVVSTLILSLVFFVVVTPIGLARRLMGIDSLKLKCFKSSQDSVMAERLHTFTREDIEKPY